MQKLKDILIQGVRVQNQEVSERSFLTCCKRSVLRVLILANLSGFKTLSIFSISPDEGDNGPLLAAATDGLKLSIVYSPLNPFAPFTTLPAALYIPYPCINHSPTSPTM